MKLHSLYSWVLSPYKLRFHKANSKGLRQQGKASLTRAGQLKGDGKARCTWTSVWPPKELELALELELSPYSNPAVHTVEGEEMEDM